MVQAWDMDQLRYWNKLMFSYIVERLSQSVAVSACSCVEW